MSALVDTNVLVYRYDPRDPGKQRVARGLLREGMNQEILRLPHQAVIEFVQAVTRPLVRGGCRPAHSSGGIARSRRTACAV